MRSALQSKWLEVSRLDTTLSFRNLGFGIALSVVMHVTVWAQHGGSEQTPPAINAVPGATHRSLGGSAMDADKASRQTNARRAEDLDGELSLGEDPDNQLIVPFVKHLADDQRTFWTAPSRFRVQDLKWIAPFAGITAGFMA